VLAYASLVFLVRVSGKRTLAKMNAFDLVVTVALGSTLATILLSKDVSLVAGVTALALLIGLQYAVAWLTVRSRLARELAQSEPRLLVLRGEFLHAAMVEERLGEHDILAALRKQGIGGVRDVEALILETDGSFSVVPAVSRGESAALEVLRAYDR
jgi:uncharacterized membrane protein YcaP (DUF421 family)